MRVLGPSLVVGAALVLMLSGGPASAETTLCTAITTLPFTINNAGVYCLHGNLTTASPTGVGITVNADNVVIDLNGHVLSNNGAGATTQAIGISTLNHRDVTVKNGTIRLFQQCVVLDEATTPTQNRTHLVEDLNVENCRFVGIRVEGQSSTVRRNVVRDTGGGLSLNGEAIAVNGQGSQVLDNLVHHVIGSGSAVGISVSGLDMMVVNNRVSGADVGIIFESGSSGAYRDNLTSSVGTPYDTSSAPSVVNAGNNH